MRAAIVALVLSGCAASGPTWADTAAAADEAGLLLAAETALLVVPANIDADDTPEETAAAAAAAAEGSFDPIGCASATLDGARVTYVLDECIGSFGLVRVSGTMDVTFMPGELRESVFHAEASDLTLRGARVSFAVDASVTRVVNVRTIEASGSGHGTSASGRAFSRSGALVARWMDSWGCLFVDSASQEVELFDRAWAAEIHALTFCAGECPMAGGSLTIDDAGELLRIDYDGTDRAAWSVDADAGAVSILCGT